MSTVYELLPLPQSCFIYHRVASFTTELLHTLASSDLPTEKQKQEVREETFEGQRSNWFTSFCFFVFLVEKRRLVRHLGTDTMLVEKGYLAGLGVALVHCLSLSLSLSDGSRAVDSAADTPTTCGQLVSARAEGDAAWKRLGVTAGRRRETWMDGGRYLGSWSKPLATKVSTPLSENDQFCQKCQYVVWPPLFSRSA